MKQFQLSFFITALLIVFLGLSMTAYSQQSRGTLQGKIVNANNEPVENVSVTLKGTRNGTSTSEDGTFKLRAAKGNYLLVISHVGMQNQEIAVEVKTGQVTTLPAITVNIKVSALDAVNVSGNKINKYSRKKSEDVAKVPLDNLENPQVYDNIPKELLDDQMVTTVDAAIKNAPGVQTMWQATGRSGDGGSYYNSRGFIVQSLLRNGVSGNVSNTVDAANIENIEVLKGPSATLFGSSLSSYGGLINRITKKPYDSVGGQFSYLTGSYGYNRVAVDVNTPLDQAKKLLFRLNTAGTYQGSFFNTGYNKDIAIDPSLTYNVNDRLSITFDAEIYSGKGVIQPIYFFPYGTTIAQLGASNANQLNINYRNSYNAGDMAEQSRSTNLFGQVNYKISEHWKSQTLISSTYSYSNGFGPYYYLQAGNNTLLREDQSTKNSDEKTLDLQENINGDFKIGNLRNRFVGGLDYLHLNSNQFFFGGSYDIAPDNSSTFNYKSFNYANMSANYALPNPSGYYTYPAIYKTDTYGAYVSDVLNITDKLLALAAVRFDHYDNHGTYSPTTLATTGMYTQNDFSPKFGLVYQLVKDKVSLFANYQNGFTNLTGTDYQGKTFKPEEANQVEGGVKLNLFEGKLSSTVSYYRINVQNVTRTYIPNPNFSIQDGTQLSKGFEAAVTSNPFKGFNVVAGFSYNDSKYTKADADVEGLRPATASSPYQANLWLSYRLPDYFIKGLGFGFGGNYASNNKVVNSVSQGVFILPEYTVLNATAFYEIYKFRFSLGVNNLTDKKYYTGYSSVNPQMLRQILGGVAYKF